MNNTSYTNTKIFTTVDDAIRDVAIGKFVIILDAADRENEGDLVMAGSLVTAQAVNFATRLAGGIAVVALGSQIAEKFALKRQEKRNTCPEVSTYTQSVDARYGLTGNGCSMRDRALTLRTLADPQSGIEDISTPGHVMPVVSDPRGLKARKGHTEASVTLMRFANLPEVAFLCEVLNEQGDAARGDELLQFATQYDIKIITIDALENYRDLIYS